MRADIHNGSEHHTLQSEAGYIDARPHRQDRRNPLHRTAGPYMGSQPAKLTTSKCLRFARKQLLRRDRFRAWRRRQQRDVHCARDVAVSVRSCLFDYLVRSS
jgi:hypothetical protein